jgi:hypothetical protein
MELRQALAQLHDMQATFQQVRQFRLLRAVTVFATSLLGIVGSCLQPLILPDHQVYSFVVYWSSIAGVAILITLLSVYVKYSQSRARWDRELWLEAAIRFVPSIMVGAIITATWCWHQTLAVIYLPGMWLLCFGLGVWSSAKVFPRSMYLVAGYYFLAGTLALLFADRWVFSPVWMGGGFGIGQLLMSGVLAYDEQKSNTES